MILLIDNLTNIDSLNYTVLSYIAIMEAVILFIELLVYVFIIHIAFHLPFHWNLRVIITVVLSQYYLPLTTRLVTLAIQMHVIPCEGEYESSKLVLFCSLCRMYYFALCCGGIIVIFMERGIASFLIVDYETKFRRYIGINLSAYMTVSSLVTAFIVTYDLVPWSLIGLCVITAGVTTTVMFLRLIRRNQGRYNRLVVEPTINNETTMQYTLSLRFQLNENIRSMKLLRNLLILCTSMHTICFILLSGARIDWMHFHSDVAAHYLDAFLNLTIAVYAILIPMVAYCSADAYRNLIRSMPIFGRLFRESKVTSTRMVVEEGNVYFSNLHKQWR